MTNMLLNSFVDQFHAKHGDYVLLQGDEQSVSGGAPGWLYFETGAIRENNPKGASRDSDTMPPAMILRNRMIYHSGLRDRAKKRLGELKTDTSRIHNSFINEGELLAEAKALRETETKHQKAIDDLKRERSILLGEPSEAERRKMDAQRNRDEERSQQKQRAFLNKLRNV